MRVGQARVVKKVEQVEVTILEVVSRVTEELKLQMVKDKFSFTVAREIRVYMR